MIVNYVCITNWSSHKNSLYSSRSNCIRLELPPDWNPPYELHSKQWDCQMAISHLFGLLLIRIPVLLDTATISLRHEPLASPANFQSQIKVDYKLELPSQMIKKSLFWNQRFYLNLAFGMNTFVSNTLLVGLCTMPLKAHPTETSCLPFSLTLCMQLARQCKCRAFRRIFVLHPIKCT